VHLPRAFAEHLARFNALAVADVPPRFDRRGSRAPVELMRERMPARDPQEPT
jgi:hypothetical protein